MKKTFGFSLQTGGNKKQVTIEELQKLEKKITLEDYEGFFDDDAGLELYDFLVEQGKAYDICRGKITRSYIKNAFEKEDVNGFIVKIKKDIVGFIVFYLKNKDLYLDLICVLKNDNTKDLPIGQLLLFKLEQYANKNKLTKIYTDAIPSALPFYKKMGWTKTNQNDKDDKINLIKDLNKKETKLKKLLNIFN